MNESPEHYELEAYILLSIFKKHDEKDAKQTNDIQLKKKKKKGFFLLLYSITKLHTRN